MTLDEHTMLLGKLHVNLLSLELVLRFFLCESKGENAKVPEPVEKVVLLTYLTNYDSLGELIKQYNDFVGNGSPEHQVDDSVVELRDALAHGRVLSNFAEGPLRLFKFGKPIKFNVPKTYDEIMTKKWFEYNTGFIHEQIDRIIACGKSRGFHVFNVP
ncbi:MAG: hypothetical protein L0Y80_08685 [Ignavibacteriae bacterium]|nr:hypothetical protein [Ignavibacteriota bacterium]